MIVSPSILSADFLNLKHELESVSSAEFIHCDIMDTNFVPNLTFGPCVLKNIKKEFPSKTLDVHLMIKDVEKYAPKFSEIGADYITFHYEVYREAQEGIDLIKSLGCKVGISIKPKTDVNVIEDLLPQLDLVLVMSVEPGFGGQKFMPNCLDKIKRLKEIKEKKGLNFLIEVDGGINKDTSLLVKEAGADAIVVGSYLFAQEDRCQTIKDLR